MWWCLADCKLTPAVLRWQHQQQGERMVLPSGKNASYMAMIRSNVTDREGHHTQDVRKYAEMCARSVEVWPSYSPRPVIFGLTSRILSAFSNSFRLFSVLLLTLLADHGKVRHIERTE